MRTFRELQDAVLIRMGDEDDEDKMRSLVKESLNTVQKQILTERRYSFMLWPQSHTLSLEAGRKVYPLHPQMAQLWYGISEESGDWLEEIPASGAQEIGDNLVTGESAVPYRFFLTSTSLVKQQPTTAGPLIVATTGGTEAAANRIIVRGITTDDEYVEEILSTGAVWSSHTSTNSWASIESITKDGEEWSRTITATINSEVILSLTADEFGKQYRMLELTQSPTAAVDFLIRFYRKPLMLVYDNDVPQIPTDYDDILVYGSLVDMQGYSRPDPSELKSWIQRRDDLINQMQQNLQQTRSTGGRNSYVNYVPR